MGNMVNGTPRKGRVFQPVVKRGVRSGNRLINSRFGPRQEKGRMMRLSQAERNRIQRDRARQANPFRASLRRI